MITATEPATSGRSPSGSARIRASVRMRERSFTSVSSPSRFRPGGSHRGESVTPAGAARSSDLHDLGLFALQEVVDLRHVLVGDLLDGLLGAVLLVRPDVPVVDELLEVMD